MYKKFLLILPVLAMLLSIPVAASDSGAGTLQQITRTVIAPGLEAISRVYAAEDGTMQAGYSLELEKSSDVYPIVMACDTIYGGMTMDRIIAYAGELGYNVVGAVNTAFYTSPGVPIGVVVENGGLRSSADGLNALAIMYDGSYHAVQSPNVRFCLTGGGLGEEFTRLEYLNKSIETDAVHIYTADFSTVSTRVTDKVWAVRLQILEGELTLRGKLKLQVTEVLKDAGAVPIGEGNVILTARNDGVNGALYTQFCPGDVLTLETLCEDERLTEARFITGCGDILVENGTLTDETQWSPFVAGNHPRTLVGWRSDGTLVMYVADGRRSGYASGLTQRMAAEEMLRQGCQTVVNMDGGGSSVIGVRMPGTYEVQTLNRPSDGGQRECAAYLLLVTDALPDGILRNWHLQENGQLVLPGQRVRLSAFGTDASLYPVWADSSQVEWSVGGAALAGNVLNAPKQAGLHKIKMTGGGASGTGNIRVITQPTDLFVTRADGRPVGDMVVENGDKLQLKISAGYYGVPIPADQTCVDYEMSVPLGYADENGVFVFDAIYGTEGTLTLRIGGYTEQIHVKVLPSRTDLSAYRYRNALDMYMGA